MEEVGSVAGLRRSGPAAALVQYHDDNYEMADAFMDSYFFGGRSNSARVQYSRLSL